MKKKQTDKKVLIPFCCMIAVLAVIAVAMVLSQFGRSANSTVEAYVDCMLEADADTMMTLYPEEAFSYVAEANDSNMTAMRANMQKKLSVWLEKELTQECGAVLDYSYEVKSQENAEEETILSLENSLGVNVKAIKRYELELTVDGETGDKTTALTVGVAKIGNSWYLFDLLYLI